MQFLNPMYLWGLTGLAVPILIHLWSRKEGTVIKVGSIQLLQASDTKKASAIKINELLLLILRMLIIALISIGMSEPLLKINKNAAKLTYVIEPELLNTKNIQRFIKEISTEAKLRYLAKGFPEIEQSENEAYLEFDGSPKYWQLAKELSTLESDSIVIIASAKATGFLGKRPQLFGNISWLKIDDSETMVQNVALVKNNDHYQLFTVNGNQTHFTFNRTDISETDMHEFKADSAEYKNQRLPLFELKDFTIVVHTADSLAAQFDYIKASLRAISKYTKSHIEVKKYDKNIELSADNCNLLIWVDEEKLINTDMLMLRYQKDDLAQNSIEPSTDSNIYNLTHLLSKENLVTGDFIMQLIDLLDPYAFLGELAENYDKRALHMDQIETEPSLNEEKNIQKAALHNSSKWVWMTLLIIIIVERLVSKIRKQ